MPSTTATQLASSRRKLRLAHHRKSSPTGGASIPNAGLGGAGGLVSTSSRRRDLSGSPAPSPTLTDEPSSAASSAASSSLSPAARRRMNRHDASVGASDQRGASRPQHVTPDPPSNVTSRGRSRGARTATRRGASETEQQSDLALNLHASPSEDSDDNGTCFDSIGTSTPRQPSPRHAAPSKALKGGEQPYQPTLNEGETAAGGKQRLLPAHYRNGRRGKSADQALSPLHEKESPASSPQGGSRPDFDTIWDHPEAFAAPSTSKPRAAVGGTIGGGGGAGGDNNSAAYSEFDQDGGGSYRSAKKSAIESRREARVLTRRSQYVPHASGASIASSRYDIDQKSVGKEDGGEEEEVLLNRPHVQAALGVGAAATLGAIVLGPVGLLVGAASVGIGYGVMQVPEEQRSHVQKRAAASLERARDVACDLSDQLNTSCAKHTGVDSKEMVEKVVPEELVDHCCYTSPEEDGGGKTGDDGHSLAERAETEVRSEGSLVDAAGRGVTKLVGDVFGDDGPPNGPVPPTAGMTAGERGVGAGDAAAPEGEERGRRAACGRKGRVVPLGQIHSLRPSLQPRAWLDVMASAHTGRDDKNEALQEILILAKDKEISRWFLEEGILDSLMFILSNYFRNYSSFLRKETPAFAEGEAEPFSSFKPGGSAFNHARLAANCCVALGKAHCAAVHTEGDLLLMSAYSRGSVPVERQLAQMLFEVPHHMKVGGPGGESGQAEGPFEAEFALTELSMQQAEDLASSIKALDDGRIDV
ncbi:hypothetical protein ACHAXT_000881 [Thalassiosira profunda]